MDDEVSQDGFSWSAPEFVEHEKSGSWYGLMVVAAAVLSAITYLLTRDIVSTAVVALAICCLGAYGARKPRTVNYHLSHSGLSIGTRHFDFGYFKSFALVPEGDALSIVLLPLKRFAPLVTIYYDHQNEDKIINILEPALPISVRKPDAIDKLMHKIGF